MLHDQRSEIFSNAPEIGRGRIGGRMEGEIGLAVEDRERES